MADSVPVEIWDAFTDQPFTGNPAGVVLEAVGLADAEMQRIAAELHLSETVFLTDRLGPGVFRARFFTPTQEVDFCGHGTVALGAALAASGQLEVPARFTLAAAAGDVPIEIRPRADGRAPEIRMTQPKPRFAPFGYRLELLAGALGLDPHAIQPTWPLSLAYTGLWTLAVPILCRDDLDRARPDFAALADLNRRLGCASTHLYTFTGPNRIHTRDFGPAVGVMEDPVTGSALGATAALLVQESAVGLTPPTTTLWAEQGHALGRPGTARIEVDHGAAGIAAVRVAGTAVQSLVGHIALPS